MAGKLDVEIVTGERVVFREEGVDMVVAPRGRRLGYPPRARPLITTLSLGELRIKKGNDEQSILVYGGSWRSATTRSSFSPTAPNAPKRSTSNGLRPLGDVPRSRSSAARARWISSRRRRRSVAPISSCGLGSGVAHAGRRFRR